MRKVLHAKRRLLRGLLALALISGALLTQGCFFCSSLYEVGQRREMTKPVTEEKSPILAAWADQQRGRVSIKYRAVVYGGSEEQIVERWLNFSRDQADLASPTHSILSDGVAPWPDGWRVFPFCSLTNNSTVTVMPEGAGARVTI